MLTEKDYCDYDTCGKAVYKPKDDESLREALEIENTEFDYGHNVKHYSED